MTNPTEGVLERILTTRGTKSPKGVIIKTKGVIIETETPTTVTNTDGTKIVTGKPTKGIKIPAKGSGKETKGADDEVDESDQSVKPPRPKRSKRKKPHNEDGGEDGGTPSKKVKQ